MDGFTAGPASVLDGSSSDKMAPTQLLLMHALVVHLRMIHLLMP